MNQKAEEFKKYLDEKKIEGVFAIEEVEGDDEWQTVLFRSQVDIQGNKLPTVVIFDKSVYGLLRVLIAPQVLREDNEARQRLQQEVQGFQILFGRRRFTCA